MVAPRAAGAAMLPTAGTMRLVEWAQEAEAANHLAKALCNTPFAKSWKGDENGATAAILKGIELGLSPVTALGAFDNIQGTPAANAITLRALVQSHGHQLEIVEANDQHAVARYRRSGKGDWQTTEFTIEHARALRLLDKDNWKKQPGNMLIARVTSKAARLVASDVILGIGYSAEEIRDLDDSGSVEGPSSGRDRMAGILGIAAPADDQPLTDRTRGELFALFTERGITDREQQIAGIVKVIGREISSRSELTEADALKVISVLRGGAAKPEPESGGRGSGDELWEEILRVATDKGVDVAEDFPQQMGGLIPDDAEDGELRAYLGKLQERAA